VSFISHFVDADGNSNKEAEHNFVLNSGSHFLKFSAAKAEEERR
jgi:hypothetical protein